MRGQVCVGVAFGVRRRDVLGRHAFTRWRPFVSMVERPGKTTLAIGLAAVAILFVPVPIVTQLIGIPLLLYASYRYWGREAKAEQSAGESALSSD